MNLSPINYQPMSIYQNRNQNSAVNFKGNNDKFVKKFFEKGFYPPISKLPLDLAAARDKAQAELRQNRDKIKDLKSIFIDNPERCLYEITTLEARNLEIVRNFNEKINKLSKYNDYKDYYLHYLH